MINSGNIKLAAIVDDVYLDAIVAAGIIGIVGGAIGSLFIRVNNKVNLLRKKILTTKFRKVLEACILVTITVTAFFFSSFYSSCRGTDDMEDILIKNKIEIKTFNCPEGSYNRLATLLFDG